MTAQASDGMRYRERDFALCEVMGGPLFEPERYGIHPMPFATNCYRGIICKYTIEDSQLFLSHLNVGLKPEERAAADRGELAVNGVRAALSTALNMVAEYHDIRLLIAFTGKIRIGADFEPGQYRTGFDPVYKFREAHELTFESGHLIEARDISGHVADERAEQEARLQAMRQLPPRRSFWRWLFGG